MVFIVPNVLTKRNSVTPKIACKGEVTRCNVCYSSFIESRNIKNYEINPTNMFCGAGFTEWCNLTFVSPSL